jgi:hypothetical protein
VKLPWSQLKRISSTQMPPYRSSVILLSSVLFVLQCDPSICMIPSAGASLSYLLFARSKIFLFFCFCFGILYYFCFFASLLPLVLLVVAHGSPCNCGGLRTQSKGEATTLFPTCGNHQKVIIQMCVQIKPVFFVENNSCTQFGFLSFFLLLCWILSSHFANTILATGGIISSPSVQKSLLKP